MYNVVFNILQQLTIIIWFNNVEKFTYNNYLSIFIFILLLYVVEINMQLGKYYNFFWLK